MKLAFDTETHGFDWFDGELAFLASWADARNEYVANVGTPEGAQTYMNALKAGDPLVAHNFSFDCHQTRATVDYDILAHYPEVHDTEIMARLAVPMGQQGGNYKLKTLAATFLDPKAKEAEEAIEEMAKSIGVSLRETPGAYYLVWRAYPDVMEHYAKQDARQTYDLHTHFEDAVKDTRSYALEQEVMPILTKAEEVGIKLDIPVVQSLKEEYAAKEQEAREPLIETLGEDALRGRGSKAVLLEALTDLGVPLYRRTRSGDIATHRFALQEFEDDFPILKTLMEWRQYDKFLSTYIGPMEDRDVVHTSFRQCEAWTGRMSSASPNMQNIPKAAGKNVRSMFIPREDHVFVVFDYDSIEVRLLAYYMASERYRKLIRDGHDPHAYMAASIHGGEPGDFEKGGPRDAERSAAKNTTFAITYGAGAPRVGDMNKIPKDDARALIRKIKSALPGYYKLNRRIKRKIGDEGYINTAFGRRQVVDREKAYIGLNSLIQGIAAEVMKQGLVQANELVVPYGATPLLVVHDELVVECPTENAREVARLMPEALCHIGVDLDPPLEVSGGIVSTNYADA
jgi:DNA polymerase-1